MAPSIGSWWTRSVKDPRFNMEGRGIISAFGCPDMDRAIKRKAQELGVEVPSDLEVGGMKD